MYALVPSSVDTVIPSSSPAIKPNDDAIVTPVPVEQAIRVPPERLGPPPPENVQPKVIHREERVEYRDAQGNILDDVQVEELKGKVKFEVSSYVVASGSDTNKRRRNMKPALGY
jgi:dolichyl-phosphate-mannose-protein mannosyltransferase